jgi:rhodanese-related sulfurtransferase
LKKGLYPTAGWLTLIADSSETMSEIPTTDRRAHIQHVILEAVLVAAAGMALAFAANLVSPRGLALTRNYFPADITRPRSTGNTVAVSNAPATSPDRLTMARLREQGLQSVDYDQVVQLFRDPRCQKGAIVFIDARDEQHFQAGHVPAAREFDPYYPEKYFAAVLPACRAAEQIVVYCNGGDCEDSESAALLLRDVGIATNKLFIYIGGIAEWTARGLPVETGNPDRGTSIPVKP